MVPRVSVLMAVRDGQAYLKEAVESVLRQTYRDFEFIIVDDGSIDSSIEILEEYAAEDSRILLLRHQPSVGLTKALNKGIAIAQGIYLARQDADDRSMPERLELQVAYLDSHPALGLLGTAYSVIDAEGTHLATYHHPRTDTEIRWQMLFHNAFCHSSVMWRSALSKTPDGWYDEQLKYSQDYDLWARLLERVAGENLDLPLVAWRQHSTSIDAVCRNQQQDLATVVAWKQIRRLLTHRDSTRDQVRTLRDWYWQLPSQLSFPDLAICKLYLELLEALDQLERIDRALLSRIRQSWVTRILQGLKIERIGSAEAAKIVASLARYDRWTVADSVWRRMILTVKETLRI